MYNIRGHTFMTPAVGGGGGPQTRRPKEGGCMNSVHDKGGGGQKSENFADVIYGSTLDAVSPGRVAIIR